MTYTVSNTGGLSLVFEVSANVGWLSLPASSSLPGGDPNAHSMEVALAFGPSAGSLGEGLHAGTLSFANTTTGAGDTTRRVELLVLPALDTDGDGVFDAADNCPFVPNGASQAAGAPSWGQQAESVQFPGVGCACLCGDAN